VLVSGRVVVVERPSAVARAAQGNGRRRRGWGFRFVFLGFFGGARRRHKGYCGSERVGSGRLIFCVGKMAIPKW
jgi:hypothetical protein